MRTVKLVVIGNSGVGKTSLRGQFVSNRFSTGYRATIGADFITKTLPHHSDPEQSVTLQIWDTAGQEHAALLMFDVNQPATLQALTRWWSEFRARAPLADEDMEEYCLVVVGNKIDLMRGSDGAAVSEGAALRFIDELVPPSESRSSSPATPEDERVWLPGHVSARVASGSDDEIIMHTSSDPTEPEDIILSRSARNSQFSLAPNGTMSSAHTGFTSFHTPASSFSDGGAPYESAPSSPLSRSRSPSPLPSPPPSPPHSRSAPHAPTSARRSYSASTMSTSCTAPTITQARYSTTHLLETAQTMPPRPPRGPKLFFTSAKTGTGVSDVFAYIAQRVTTRWEWEEARGVFTVDLGDVGNVQNKKRKAVESACCSS
ncbi:P-loop containing nucleoside triphosphate hydrolase protein [Multifurca ochricompacta]|uniref:P-loop containing nucleoside triphosphate hydrolase protein n=1 Tax=Multifurca ochricompacta TaxID=376703 RepID=A0AAD4QJK2_9AGAM|nr:P-loop containing nucleoside triphosphate hydrolase protein [Multifurca ochricompacta]